MNPFNPQRILIIASWGDSLVNFRGLLINELIRRGHCVYACAPDISSAAKTQLKQWGASFHRIKMVRAGINPLSDCKTLWSLYRLINRIKPDMVMAYTVKPVIYGSIASRLAGKTEVYSIITGVGSVFIHHSLAARLIKGMITVLYRIALQLNKVVYFQNPDDYADFLRFRIVSASQRTQIINGSGVDLDFYHMQSMPARLSFLLAARLIKDKGIETYVAAARIVKAKHPQTKFYLAGWIDATPAAIERSQLDQWIEDGPIEYLGYLTDIKHALGMSSVFVLPSLREGTPRSVLEAMATGRPIITTDVPGCRETVQEGVNGFLVSPHDPENLADAMLKIIEDPQRLVFMGKNSRKLAEEKYNVHHVNQEILKGMNLV